MKDIAHIDEYSEERDSISREKGKETISLYLFKASLANTIILSRNVNKLIDTIKTSDINIEVSYDEAIFIKKAILNLIMSILIGGFLAALILIIYIKSLRQSIAILITMPISVCCVIIFFSLSGISFNLISLSGFAVAVGMLVDNGIIFIEKFNDQYKANRDSALSCKLVIDEINTPILASTLTTICIFLPFLVFNTSTDIYKDLSGAFVVSLLSSYFGAMIIIPFFLKNFYINKLKIEDSKFMYKLDFIYKNSIKGLKFRNIDKLAKQLRQIITTKNSIYIPIWFILGILSIFLFSRIPNNYGELFERNEIYATLDLETGIDINRTSDLVNSIEKIIMSEKGIASVSSDIKKGHCSFIIKLGNNAEKDKIIEKIRERTVLPESASLIFEKGRDESESNNINIEIKGKDIAVIREISDSLVKNLYGNDKIKDVIYRYREGGPQYEINLNNDKIDQIGLNNMEVAEYIRNTFYGPVISKFIDKREIDIRCITGDKNKYDINILRYLPMLTKSGSITHLGELSEIIKNKSISTIWRKEKTRFEMISVTPSTRFIDKLVSEIKQTVELIKIPEDYEVEIGKNIENKNDDLKETMFLLIISISLIYIVVAVIYESLMIPIYIFFAIPTAFTGSIITLYLTGRSITIAVYLGLLVLCGIAVNNTILFIDQMLKTHGKLIKSSEDVILQIVNDRKRAINITTKTTILGLIPMLFASEGSVLGFDFAITIISGILYSKICILHIFPKFFIKND